MESWKSKSLEHINIQFRSIMEDMGIDEEKQHKLAAKLNLSKKIKTITSMQTMDERKKKIREYVVKLSDRNSVLNLLSLSCSLESGPDVLYEIFTIEGGHDVLVRCMRRMDDEFSDAICDTLSMILSKYGNHFPPFLRPLLDRFICGKIQDTKAFFKIIEFLVNEGKAEELFYSIDFNRCVCNTYLSRIIEHVMRIPRVVDELNFLITLLKSARSVHVKYILFVSGFHQLEQRVVCREIYDVIAKEIRCSMTGDFRKDRIEEILRIAESQGHLDIVCCVAEAFVFGDREIFKNVEVRSREPAKCMIEEKAEEQSVNEKECVTMDTGKPKPKKIIKKVVKNAMPSKKYMPVKWKKIGKGSSLWSKINIKEIEGLFSVDDFEAFEVKEEKPKTSSVRLDNKRPSVFSEKKSYAINIALGRVKVSNYELKQTIVEMRDDFDENLVKQLLFYFPTDEEIEHLQVTEDLFGRGEEFFKECIDEIEMIKRCLYYLYFATSFKDQCLMNTLSILREYYEVLLRSNELRKFLGVALAVGNYLNMGSFLGNAEGFTMDSIPTILEAKNNDASLFRFIERRINARTLVNELFIVHEASRMNFEALCVEIDELKKNYINANGSSFARIQEKMDEIQPRYDTVCLMYEDVVRLHRECGEYFGESIDDEFNSRMILFLDRLSHDLHE
ncbi:formin homology 2 domain-containing protein [Ordospora colligata]|uniref:Formin homology 2 domain-containing protein n=1 Tax=Ordospora colligata OC4 TaxID=1354746 RepID=A0A0B2UJ67_9MICR|nr:formin homology 2 domain-containing protein [Ordospora colligata OC4]KHN69383.1 formin homology 2 domain-containing protein [Ordospora colligata OC4]TBU14897.1 formin homology 2 domain-containing protein [Ordospora colligata]TBU15028.1 formin homology 2 domain-containing protein [Ordospora colligata]TBU18282.1 formin homology 2 domain-containing protein [Ordospora colligata]